jgi:membrane protease subunit HflK
VETAKQGAETVVNEAKAYQNAEIPKAQAQADQVLQNAEFLKQSRINDATERIALFEAMYSEYINNPEITRSRMYYEIITKMLPDVKIFINTSQDGVEMMLPLDDFMNGSAEAPTQDTGVE